MTRQERELKSIHTAQRAFYGKALVIDTIDSEGITGRTELQSYDTIIAWVEFGHALTLCVYEGELSKTSRRHLREFVVQQFNVRAWDIVAAGLRHGVRRWDYATIC